MCDLPEPSVNGRAFDEVAAAYDRARPGYPDALFDDLMQIATLGPMSRVLEVGPGTGQATRSFAKRGLSIVSLEPGATLARMARANLASFPRVRILDTSFEAWTIEAAAFDLVAGAQSFHWIDPAVGFAHAHAALRPGGILAIFGNVPRRGQSELNRLIDHCYQRFAPELQPKDDRPTQLALRLAACELFEILPARHYPWQKTYSAAEYIDLLSTHSDHHRLEEAERTALLDSIRQAIESHGGCLSIHYDTKLLLGRRPQ